MKRTTIRLFRITALMSACAGATYVVHVVSKEVAYVHAKVSKPAAADIPRRELRWPEAVALPELRISVPRAGSRAGTDD